MSGAVPDGRPSVALWLVRHGETSWARERRHTGRTDVPLTDHGRAQARALRERLEGVRFAAVRCSPLTRARETLELALPGVPRVLDEDLQERDYGDAEGRTTVELRAEQPGWTSWTTPTPNAETITDVGERADRAIARAVDAALAPEALGPTRDAPAPAPVLLVAHGHLLRVLAARWLGQPAGFGAQLVLGTASLSILGEERGSPAVVRWNA